MVSNRLSSSMYRPLTDNLSCYNLPMERDCYFDNCKAILIILVVLGHLIEPWIQSSYGVRAVYLFIYSFHIPVFVFISGYFAKYIKDYSAKEVRYLGLFLLFTLLYLPFTHQSIAANLLTPYWLLWFLVSLVAWYALLQFFRRLPHPIIIAVVLAMAAGYIDAIGYPGSLSRTLVFFPFFLLGYYTDKASFIILDQKASWAILGAALAFATLYATQVDPRWLYGSYSYSTLGATSWFAGIYRLILYALASIVGLAFLSLIPTSTKKITHLGQYTLWIFLFHGLVIKLWSVIVLNQA